MLLRRAIVTLVVLAITAGIGVRAAVEELTCEYLRNPLCVMVDNPRLGWKLTAVDSKIPVRQTAYRILAATSPEKLSVGKADLWDSGKVVSSESCQIPYGGLMPDDVAECYWTVGVWTAGADEPQWSEPASWGRMTAQWSDASWIGDEPDSRLAEYLDYVAGHNADADFDADRWRQPPTSASPLLRKSFDIPAGRTVKRARLHASALGYYDVMINGRRVSDNTLAPEWTDYDRYVQFQTYDVEPLLTDTAENVIGAVLADGWALGRLAGIKWMRSFPHRGHYAPERRLIAILDIELDNGERVIVPTDSTWSIKRDGYTLSADNFAGQTIDARRIPHGWATRDYDASAWDRVYVDRGVNRRLVAQPNEPITVHAELRPKRIWRRADGAQMIDFGQNIAGHCALRVKGEPGQKIVLRHGEWLEADSTLYTRSLGYAVATDTFYLSGNDDYFEPDMTYHGFQYAELTGLNDVLSPDALTAKAISSGARAAGRFSCSDEALNQLYRNIVWTQRNNMLSVITDNPSRDERTGALGDIQIFCQASIFNMDMAAFYTKMLGDIQDTAPNGQFFSMVPSLRNAGLWEGWIGAPGWCEAGLIVPWRMYVNYGDTRALERLYGEMRGHIDATCAENPDLVWRNRHNHNGDWLNANTIAPEIDPTYPTTRGATPDDAFATAFLAYSTRLLADIAGVLRRDADHDRYSALADSVKAKFIEMFVDADGRVDGDSQGAYSLALFYDLVPDSLREKAFGHLLRCIEEYDYRLSTGFITTPMMMQTLTDFGRSDVAYRLLTSTRFPSWLNIVNNGATTVWERWDAWSPEGGFQNATMNSLDHVAFGAVSEWMFRNILGINPDEERPGYEHFTLRPQPGGGLTWARGSYDSVRGQIASEWESDAAGQTYTFTIPANSSATVILQADDGADINAVPSLSFERSGDGEIRVEAESGTYRVTVRQ